MDIYYVVICSLAMSILILVLYVLAKLLRNLTIRNGESLTSRNFYQCYVSKKHHWIIVDTFDPGCYCNVCETSLFHGLRCDFCGVISDESCAQEADRTLTCKCLSSTSSRHLWLFGNLPHNSECAVCECECGLGAGLNDFQCSWCRVTCHEKCLQCLSSICDYGEFKPVILPPNCVKLTNNSPTSKIRSWKRYYTNQKYPFVYDIKKPYDASGHATDWWRPLLVFVNTKSGNGEGDLVLRAFRRSLNPVQVFDLAEVQPEFALRLCKLAADVTFNVVVAGGDGTIGWVLTGIEKMRYDFNQKTSDNRGFSGDNNEPLDFRIPPVYVLPLGTGNDLSRFLGCGSTFDCHKICVDSIVRSILSSKSIDIDRWRIKIHQKKLGVRLPVKSIQMTNYVSIGVDALVTYKMHRRRYSMPRVVSGRLMNKFLFFTYGTKDLLERSCRDLNKNVELYMDNVRVPLPDLEGLTVLNIPYWGAGVKVWEVGRSADGYFPDMTSSATMTSSPTTPHVNDDVIATDDADSSPSTATAAAASVSSSSKENRYFADCGTETVTETAGTDPPADKFAAHSSADHFCRHRRIHRQDPNDGYVEVIGLYSSFHMAQLQVALSEPVRLGRAKHVKLVVKNGALPMQVDGEPWLQYAPATVTVSYYGKARFLATRRSELVTAVNRPYGNGEKSADAVGGRSANFFVNSGDFVDGGNSAEKWYCNNSAEDTPEFYFE